MDTSSWLQVLGRLHPLILHLPIGLIVGLAIFEFAAVCRPSRPRSSTIVPLAWLCALFAIAAATTGYVLADRDGYATDAVTPHLILGIFTALAAVVTALTYSLSSRVAAPRASLLVTLGLLTATGHLGASLTHGPDFLTGPLARAIRGQPPEPLAQAPAPPAPSTEPAIAPASAPHPESEFALRIKPILDARCISCHGDKTRKGGLALTSPDLILRGGKSGPALRAGDAASPILVRVRLPLDDKHHMPPRSKAQPTAAEIDTLAAWIASGASFAAPAPSDSSSPPAEADAGLAAQINADKDAPPARDPTPAGPPSSDPPHRASADASAATAPPEVKPLAAASTPAAAKPAAIPSPDPAALARLREKLAFVASVSREDPLLSINFAAEAKAIDDDTAEALLKPLAANIAELNLARTKVGAKSLAVARSMPNLRRLNLRSTPITDADLAALEGHPSLAELVVSQTTLTDASATVICAMPALKHVYLWKSGLGEDAVKSLRDQRPDLAVNTGDGATTEVLEQETTVKFTSEAPAPGTPAPAGGTDAAAAIAAALKPINDTCPVSGAPIDPKYSVLYEGRVIGFCCPNCPKEFWADPQTFLAKLPPR